MKKIKFSHFMTLNMGTYAILSNLCRVPQIITVCKLHLILMMKTVDYDCIVVGAGPGGLVSALYLARYRRKILIVHHNQSRARWIPKIRNLVGYIEGISGKALLRRIQRQLRSYPIDSKVGQASLRRIRGGFQVTINSEKITCRKIVLATGMRDVDLRTENLAELKSQGVLAYCPICDGFEYQRKKVALFVRNNQGLRKLKFLASLAPHITVFQTREFKIASQYIREMKERKIHRARGPIRQVLGDSGKLQIKAGRKIYRMDVGYVELGTQVDSSATKHIKKLKRNQGGFLKTDSHQQTSVPGLFAVGDCASGLSQISVAIGHAATAATKIHNDLLRRI